MRVQLTKPSMHLFSYFPPYGLSHYRISATNVRRPYQSFLFVHGSHDNLVAFAVVAHPAELARGPYTGWGVGSLTAVREPLQLAIGVLIAVG